MDDVHIGVMDQVAPVMISLEFCSEPLLTLLDRVVQVVLVHVADCHQAATLVACEVEIGHSDSSDSDDASGHLVARSDELAG